ncbi:USP15 [Cordylochernes scorpioides]|uniref:ubiquitinyl hydrolase 1 n=1 Tax=Cordylochernes scorpioides TaxID=51811 RepID=A0ABY6K4I0_9ARAC|nr:USP15 [Cordylochernes scorpioides]
MHQQRVPHKKSVVGLSECLELFTTTERLGVEDPWFCPACRKHQQATKKFDLWSLPRGPHHPSQEVQDLSVVCGWCRGLDMSRYVINQEHGPAVYDLIAVANHYGGWGAATTQPTPRTPTQGSGFTSTTAQSPPPPKTPLL